MDEDPSIMTKQQILNYLIKDINQIIRKDLDLFTIDKLGRIIIVFPELNADESQFYVSKILSNFFEKNGVFFNIYSSIKSCPEHGINFKELMITSNLELLKQKEKNEKNTNTQFIDGSLNFYNSFETLDKIDANLKKMLINQIESLLLNLKNYDQYLSTHCAIVSRGSVMLAKELGLNNQDVEKITISALLHDIGYMHISKNILYKTEKLTQHEFAQIRLHPLIATEKILKPLKLFDDYFTIIQSHHEYINGTGYPLGLKGDRVPIGAQIISVLDSFHAMSVDRPYRKALQIEQILDYYIKNAGIKWDNSIITALSAMISDEDIRYKILFG